MKAIFKFEDGGTRKVTYPLSPRGLKRQMNGVAKRPIGVRFYDELPPGLTTEEAFKAYKWMDHCEAAVQWSYIKPPQEDTPAATDKVGTLISMIPVEGLDAIGKVFVEGLRYGRDNWKKGTNDPAWQEERLNHAIIHLQKWANGDRSEDHLAKVAWFCCIQIKFEVDRDPIN